jgi:hypothetical protein
MIDLIAKSLKLISGNSNCINIHPSADDQYAGFKWIDRFGNVMAMIVAHEKNSKGEVHNHLSIYTCDEGRKSRTSRFDLQFDKKHPIFSFEDCRVRLKGNNSQLEIRSPNGRYWRVQVDDDGNLTAVKVPSE